MLQVTILARSPSLFISTSEKILILTWTDERFSTQLVYREKVVEECKMSYEKTFWHRQTDKKKNVFNELLLKNFHIFLTRLFSKKNNQSILKFSMLKINKLLSGQLFFFCFPNHYLSIVHLCSGGFFLLLDSFNVDHFLLMRLFTNVPSMVTCLDKIKMEVTNKRFLVTN